MGIFQLQCKKNGYTLSEEAEKLAALAREKDCLIFEAVTTLYLDCYRKIAQWLPRIGQIKLVQSQFTQYSSRYDAVLRGEKPAIFDPEFAGGCFVLFAFFAKE